MVRWQRSVFAGMLASGVCLVLFSWLDSKEMASRRRDLEGETRLVARQFASRMQGGLREHLTGLGQMANFWRNSEEVTEQEFYDFASETLKLTSLCLRISVVDPSLHVRWVYPPAPNQSLVGFDVKAHPQGHATLLRAMQTKETALSPPLELVGGAQGFVLTSPIFRKGKFLGAVVCSFRSRDFFAALVLSEVLGRYEEMVVDSGTFLYASKGFGSGRSSGPCAVEKLSLGGRTWEMRVKPRDEIVLARLQSGRTVFWTLGSILALLAGMAGWAGTNRAVRTRMRLRAQGAALQQTRERLDGAMRQLLQAEKMTALGELVAGVAHEVNNPLASIMGYNQLALTRDLPPEVRRYLETACSEAERAGKIVRNLLTFARKQPPEKKYLGLNGIIEKTLELKAYHFRTSQIEVEKDLAPDLPMTMLDFHQIQQVLLNLLNNAEQAMVEGGRGGRIRVATRRVGERLEARVSDTGPGISPEIQGRIFEPFFTTKQEGKGTGLGLSLCYGIIQEHGGEIQVKSELGEGATFILHLPIVEAPSTAQEALSPTLPSSTKGLRILVIDDEPNVQALLVDLLTAKGHRVDTASDVPDALRKIAANGHDVIISDMRMPHGTGRDIYAAVVTRSPRLARRIVFTTGDGASAETQRFIREAGNEVLLKPCKIEDIDGAIARAMSN